MAWKETDVVDQRMRFVMDYQSGAYAIAGLCRAYAISRCTGYKWLKRYAEEGVEGLKDRSRAPHRHPRQVLEAVIETIIACRSDFPWWGPKKIRHYLMRTCPAHRWPAASTIGEILTRHGLTVSRRRRRRVPPQTAPFADCDGPNTMWCADFKGWFRTGNGARCEPLTISDVCSRYLLRCQVMPGTGGVRVKAVFQAAFREYGLPEVIRTDNGSPFASHGVGGLSTLSVWWITLGIVPERIDPGQPQQNGRHERIHLTLKQAVPPAATLRDQQRAFDRFRYEYNDLRPHEALGQVPPAEVYTRSPRPYPVRLSRMRYPETMTVRRVQKRGEFHWRGHRVFLGEALAGEPVGLEPEDDRYWTVRFGPVVLGVFDAHRLVVVKPNVRGQRRGGTFRRPFRSAPGTPEGPIKV